MVADWEVTKTQGVCAGCGQGLQPGEVYYAALFEQLPGETQAEGKGQAVVSEAFRRSDYCPECWVGLGEKAFCFWKTRLAEPTQKKKLLVDDAVLLNFFERLSEAEEQSKINFRFVLALILMRKWILKYRQTELRDGHEVWIMGQVRETTVHEVVNPRLDDGQIEEVSEQLSCILQSEL